MSTAIVTAGAGARGAYEAGILSRVLPKLIDEEKEQEIVLVGTSAGAINSALIAGAADRGAQAAAGVLGSTWRGLSVDKVFDCRAKPFLQYAAQALGVSGAHVYALFDTAPLQATVTTGGYVDWAKLREKFGSTWLKAAGLVATEVSTGDSVVFVEGLAANVPPRNAARGIVYREATLGVEHVLASAAIPIAFSSIQVVPGQWFVDGGVRLNTPIAPAIDLLAKVAPGGNHRIVVVSTEPDPNLAGRAQHRVAGRPDIIDEATAILHSALVDRVAEDVLALRQVNALLQHTGHGHGGHPKFRVIDHCYFGPPSRGRIAREAETAFSQGRQPAVLKVLSHLLGNKGRSHDELLSFLLFDPGFLGAVFAMGQQDADAQMVQGKLPWRT